MVNKHHPNANRVERKVWCPDECSSTGIWTSSKNEFLVDFYDETQYHLYLGGLVAWWLSTTGELTIFQEKESIAEKVAREKLFTAAGGKTVVDSTPMQKKESK